MIANLGQRRGERFGAIVGATQNMQRLNLDARQMTLAESAAFADQTNTNKKMEAIERLRDLTPETIDQASPADLALINSASIGGMLSIARDLKAREATEGAGAQVAANAPREVKLLAAMQSEVGPDGDITQSNLWNIMTTGKNKEKSRAEIKREFMKSILLSPMGRVKTPAEVDAEAELLTEAIIPKETPKDIDPDPAKRTKKVKTGDPIMDEVLNEFERAKRKEAIDALLVPSHSARPATTERPASVEPTSPIFDTSEILGSSARF